MDGYFVELRVRLFNKKNKIQIREENLTDQDPLIN
jgi:hypothetical protein